MTKGASSIINVNRQPDAAASGFLRVRGLP
ncbi:hypothetical protein NIPOLPBK_00373 [Stenotrophomonas maltophilia]|nr:hypothetical protein NIPOLPBK_00373 [Stenotrophomonas maltophilia]WBL69918.1 hypothetical protein SMAL454_37770 [Stenotrophomonas maltophilia]